LLVLVESRGGYQVLFRNTTGLLTLVLFLFAGSAVAGIHDVQIPDPGEVGQDVYLEHPGVPLSPPANPEVGDSWTWWLWTWQPMPPHFEQKVCTVRGKSDRGYVVVEDSEWMVTIDQADVDSILEHWNNSSIGSYPDMGIYELDSLCFGDPPDELDNDPRIYLMWYDFQISADGFFFFFDEYPEGTYPEYHSNECEVLYLNTTSSGGPSGDYMHSVMAHEFQHLIHWKYDDNEVSWVNEGLSELAMWFYGNPDNISSFNSNPDNDLTVWDGAWADYIQTYLWTLYFFEQYGGNPAVYALVHEPANSMAGYDIILDQFGYSQSTQDVFTDWTVANFLDDTSIADGQYGYTGDDLPVFYSTAYSSYPVEATKSVHHWAADYYRFQSIPFSGMILAFDGADDNQYGVNALVLHSAAAAEVLPMSLDQSTQSGTLTVNGLSSEDEVILAVASVSSTGGPTYQFSAGDATGITGGSGELTDLTLVPSVNPFNSTVTMQLGWSGNPGSVSPSVNVFDTQGRLVYTSSADIVSAGSAVVQWNGTLSDGSAACSGIYYARAEAGTEQCTAKLVLIR